MQQINVIIKSHKWGWIGHILRKDESSMARQAMQTVGVQELSKTWPDLKQLAQSGVRWRVGVVDALCPGRVQGN